MSNPELKAAVHKHRDELASALEFCPRIEKLIDADHCLELQSFIHGLGAKWERRPADRNLGRSIPDERGLYMFVWEPAFSFELDSNGTAKVRWVLYVGKAGMETGVTDTIKRRYTSEYSRYVGSNPDFLWGEFATDCRDSRFRKFLNLSPLYFWYMPLACADVRDICLAERQLIRLFNPPLNIAHTRRLRMSKPEPAF